MKSERTKYVRFPVLSGYRIEIVVADDPVVARSKRNKNFEPYEGAFTAIHSADNNGNAVIVLPKTVDVNLIAHESWHAVKAMLEWASIPLDNEVVAYHLGYLTQQVHDFVRSCSKRTRT